MIPQRNLSILSNRIAKEGGRRIPEAILERDYCLSWFLIGLYDSKLNDILLFKGGTAIKKCYIPEYRFSEDMDFTIAKESSFENIIKSLDEIFSKVEYLSGIKIFYSRPDKNSHENTYTFFLGYEGPLPGSSNKEIKVDITIKEKIVFPIEKKIILKGYKEYEDLPNNKIINSYSINEIVTEKVVAILDIARNEPRDLYDVWYLTSNNYVNLSELVSAVEEKLKFRNKKLSEVKDVFKLKESRLKRLWEVRLSSQMVLLPEFEQVYRMVQKELRRIDKSSKTC